MSIVIYILICCHRCDVSRAIRFHSRNLRLAHCKFPNKNLCRFERHIIASSQVSPIFDRLTVVNLSSTSISQAWRRTQENATVRSIFTKVDHQSRETEKSCLSSKGSSLKRIEETIYNITTTWPTHLPFFRAVKHLHQLERHPTLLHPPPLTVIAT